MIVTCPPPGTLRRYLLGDFSDGEGAELESHLSECAACEETLSHFDDTHDSLLRHLPLAAGTTEDKNSPWLERLMQGPPPPRDDDPSAEEPAAGLVIEGLENYELTGVLGKGGMGVVYRARHRQLNRPVAIKVIRPKLFSAAEARQRFAREIQILGGLNHPGIVAATDAGKIGPAAYLVMELIDGVDFSRLVRRGGPLAIGEACEVARQIAAALSAVHEAGAIHRDIKPSNVMLDRAGRVKLLDFGLAHLAQPEREHPETSMGRLLGTLDFMAPEQADGETVGPEADLYAIGATLFFLLTGRPPRSGEGEQTLLQQLKSLVQNEIPPLASLRADVPQQLSDLVAELLAKDPADRPATAPEVAQRLAAWSDREAVERLCEALPPTTGPEGQESISQSLSQSLNELLGSQLASKVEPHIAPEPLQTSPRRRIIGKTLLALAMLGAALCAGIALLIETPSGTIRIESDVAGIQVELLDEQEQTKTLEIKQGENRSELKAGRYRILIAGGHDHLAVSPKEITLQRGEEKIARITQVAAEGEVVQTDSKGQPLYQGEPLSVWEQRFRDETDPLAKIEAGKALVLLARPLPPRERFTRIMWVGGQLIGDGWNNPALRLESMRNPPFPEGYRRPTSWPTDAKQTVLDEFAVLRDLSASQLAAEEPVALATRLSAHFAHEDDNERWFAVQVIYLTALDRHLSRSKPASDILLAELRHPEDKDLNRVSLLRSARFFPHGSVSGQGEYARVLSLMGKKLAEQGLPRELAWLGESWSNTARVVGVEPQIRAEVAFRHLIDHGVDLMSFDLSEDKVRSLSRRDRLPVTQMAEHWIHLTNRWLEGNKDERIKDEQGKERLANAINSLDAPLRIRPINSDWEVDRTAQLLAAVLKSSYELRAGGRKSNLNAHQLLTQIILCGGEIPQFAKQPPSGDEMQKRLEAFREVVIRPGVDEGTRATASGVMLDAPFTTMEILVTNLGLSSQNRRSNREITAKLQTAIEVRPRTSQPDSGPWKSASSILILAILAELSGESPDRDAEIAGLLWTGFAGTRIFPRIQDLLQSEFATRQITEHHLRKIKQRIENEDIWEGMKRLAPYLVEALENEQDPQGEPAKPADAQPANQPAEIDDSGSEPLYLGEPVSVWERRFRAETDPLAKIKAGKALVSLAQRLPSEARFARIMWVGGQLTGDGWNTPALRLESMRNPPFPEGYRPPTSWPSDEGQTVLNEFAVLRDLAASQLTAEEPLALAKQLTNHVSRGDLNEAWFAIGVIGSIALESRYSLTQPASDMLLGELRRPEDKDLNRVALLRSAHFYSRGSEPVQAEYARELESMGDELAETGLPAEEAWLGNRWTVIAQFVGISPRIRAEVTFRQLIDHGVAPTAFALPSDNEDFSSRAYRLAATQMAEHWIHLTNRWLESNKDEQDTQRLTNVINALDAPLRIRPVNSDWQIDRTRELVTELLKASYEDQAGGGKSKFESHQLLAQIVLCGGDIPEFAKQPPSGDEIQEKLRAFRSFRLPASGVMLDAPFATMDLITSQPASPNPPAIISQLEVASGSVRAGRNPNAKWMPVDSLLIVAILADLSGQTPDRDEVIAKFFHINLVGAGIRPSIQDLLQSEFTVRQIAESQLRKIKQKTESENLLAAIDRVAPRLDKTPESEEQPKDDPAKQVEDPPANQPAEVDHSGPEPLYQGEPVSVWQRRFRAETDPLAKINVGQALITLARPMPEEERFDTVMKIGSELLESGWGASGAIQAIVRHQNAMGYEFHAPRWPASSAEAIEKSWGGLRESIDIQLESIPPGKLAELLTGRVAKGQGLDPHFVLFLLQNTRDGYLTEGIRIVRENRSASEQIVRKLQPGDGQSAEARHLREAALLVRTLYDASVSEEAQQQLREEMVALGERMIEPDFVPVSGYFVRAWRWQAKQLKLDPRLSAEVALAGLVGKWNVVPVEIGIANSPGGGPWPKNRYGQPWTSGQELFLHWGPVAMDWLREQSPLEEASAEKQEIRVRVLTSLDTALRLRRVTDDWDPEELAQLLVEQFPRSVHRDTVVLLCGADLPESSRQPPESEVVEQRLETLRQLLGAGATQYQNGRAQLEGLFDQAPYATLQMIIEAEQLPDEIPPPRVVWDTLQVDAARNPFGHGYQDRDVEPLLLLAITAELAGKSPARDERILQFFNPGEQLSFSSPLQVGLKSDGVISQIITRHLRKMKQRAKSEKLREAIDKLVPGLEDTPDVEPDPAMPADAPPATQPAKVDDSGPEALYQGEPVSVWQRRFEVEVNPISKIEAAKGVIALASRLPPEEQLDRIVKIGGELLREGWGDGATRYPLNQYLGIMHTPNRWSMNTYPTIWDDFRLLLSMIDGQIHQISPEILARHLTDQVVGAEPHEAAFAMLPLVGHVRNRKQLNQEAAEILTVELRREDLPQLHRAAFLIRLAGYEAASDEARQKVVDDMQSVGQKLNEKGWEDSKRVQSAFCADGGPSPIHSGPKS